MKVYDFRTIHDVYTVNELEAALRTRYDDGRNCFSLAPESHDYPLMLILAAGDLAYVHYDHPEDVTNGAVVPPFDRATGAAKGFFVTQELPKSLTWDEL
jgi:hypothetical protein